MRHGALFNGIGGFQLAAHWCGIKNIWHSEINEFCNNVIAMRFPESKNLGDIKNVTKETAGSVDIISRGFPCQPFSVAGKRKGKEDDRYLWEEMFRVICELKPTWVIGENVTGIINMVLDEVLADLESENYETQTFIIPACSVGAWHRRNRIWIISYNEKARGRGLSIFERNKRKEGTYINRKDKTRNDSDTHKSNDDKSRYGASAIFSQEKTKIFRDSSSLSKCNELEKQRNISLLKRSTKEDWWAIEPRVDRVANGIPNRVDRLKSLGNAIVPQVAYVLFKEIKNQWLGANIKNGKDPNN